MENNDHSSSIVQLLHCTAPSYKMYISSLKKKQLYVLHEIIEIKKYTTPN